MRRLRPNRRRSRITNESEGRASAPPHHIAQKLGKHKRIHAAGLTKRGAAFAHAAKAAQELHKLHGIAHAAQVRHSLRALHGTLGRGVLRGAYCGGGGAYCRCGRGISSIFAMCSRSPGARKGSIAPRYSAARSRPCSLRMREAIVYAGEYCAPCCRSRCGCGMVLFSVRCIICPP